MRGIFREETARSLRRDAEFLLVSEQMWPMCPYKIMYLFFEGVQRHTLVVGKKPSVVFTTDLTRFQRKILR